MSQLGGIWAANQPVMISFVSMGSSVQVTIGANCVAACTNPDEDLGLIGGIPAAFLPTVPRGCNVAVQKQDLPINGTVYVDPQGHMLFAAVGGWALDAATASGVLAQTFSYLR